MSTFALNERARPLGGILMAAPGRSAVATVAAIATGAAALLQPGAIGGVVDAISRGAPAGPSLGWLAGVIVLAIISGAVGTFATGTYAATSVLFLRQRLITHVIGLGPSARPTVSAGDLTSRLTLDTTTPATILPTAVGVAVSSAVAIGALVAMSIIDWRLTVTFLVAVPMVMLIVRRFVVDAGNLTGHYRKLQSEIATRLLDAHAGMRTIQVSGTHAREVARVTAPLPQLAGVGRDLWSSQRRVSWQTTLLLSTVEVLVLAVAGIGVSEGRVQPGQLVAAAGYVALAMAGFDSLDAATGLVQARVGMSRVNEVLSVGGPGPAGAAQGGPAQGGLDHGGLDHGGLDHGGQAGLAGATLLGHGKGEVRFENVTVLREGHAVLDGVTLTVPAGASVAVIGRSGAGKSTLAALVGRLVEPDQGRVMIDGSPVGSVPERDLHNAVAYAFERPARLGETVEELIGIGAAGQGIDGDTMRARATEAARAAHADAFIRRLPNGYATRLERAPFSGGELQRLGIAQALSRPAHLLVFDDATSSLDMATELDVMTAVEEARAGRTMLIVTQRVTTAARADLVIWLEEGRVKGYGPHRELCLDPGYLATIAPGMAEEVTSS